MLIESPPSRARISDRLVDAVFFTGSNATGLKIAELGAKSLLKVQLELGGKDGVYVHHDVPIDDAAAGLADGVLYNNGQGCKFIHYLFSREVRLSKSHDQRLFRGTNFCKRTNL